MQWQSGNKNRIPIPNTYNLVLNGAWQCSTVGLVILCSFIEKSQNAKTIRGFCSYWWLMIKKLKSKIIHSKIMKIFFSIFCGLLQPPVTSHVENVSIQGMMDNGHCIGEGLIHWCHMRCPFYYFTSPIFWTFTWSSSRTNILHELVDTNYINRTVFASWIQWCKNIS